MIAEKPLILVVDDDAQVAAFTSLLLEKAGYRVLQAISGEEAVALWNPEVDLLLTDLAMPGLMGDQLAVRLLGCNPALKVIFMSGNLPGTVQTLIPLQEGENFLQKPYLSPELIEIVENALGGACKRDLIETGVGESRSGAPVD